MLCDISLFQFYFSSLSFLFKLLDISNIVTSGQLYIILDALSVQHQLTDEYSATFLFQMKSSYHQLSVSIFSHIPWHLYSSNSSSWQTFWSKHCTYRHPPSTLHQYLFIGKPKLTVLFCHNANSHNWYSSDDNFYPSIDFTFDFIWWPSFFDLRFSLNRT
jgi:hypothetical protein